MDLICARCSVPHTSDSVRVVAGRSCECGGLLVRTASPHGPARRTPGEDPQRWGRVGVFRPMSERAVTRML